MKRIRQSQINLQNSASRLLLGWILSFLGSLAYGDSPNFTLDRDFAYFSEDEQSLRNLKFYPETKKKYEKIFLNLRKGLETAEEGLILMHLAYALKEVDEFEEIAKFVLKKDSRLDDARVMLAAAAIAKNQPYLAQTFISQIKDKTLSSSVRNIEGLVAFQLKQTELAVRIFKQALKKESKNYALGMNLGLIYMEFQMYKVAEKHFSSMVKKHKNGYDAKLHLAMALGAQKKFSKAKKIIEDLEDLFPSSSVVKKTRELLNRGK